MPLEETDIKNRYEIRLENDRAYHAIQDLSIYRNCEKTGFNIINSYITFLEVNKAKKKSKWEMDAS